MPTEGEFINIFLSKIDVQRLIFNLNVVVFSFSRRSRGICNGFWEITSPMHNSKHLQLLQLVDSGCNEKTAYQKCSKLCKRFLTVGSPVSLI